jgi:predicted dehydrogenase
MQAAKEEAYQQRVGYRTGDMWAPNLEVTEALQVEAEHFVNCIERGERSLSDGYAGLRVVQILEAASRSLTERGRPVTLGWKGREV